MRIAYIYESGYVLFLVIGLSKLFGLFRDVALANYFGTSSISDAYIIAFSVPSLLFYFLIHALTTAYIPIYNQIYVKNGRDFAIRYSNNVVSISLLFSLIIVLCLMLWPEFIIKIFAAGFDEETIAITSKFIRIASPSLFFMVFSSAGGSFLNINKNYLIPGAIGIPRNIILILSIYFAYVFSIDFLGFGILLAFFSEFLLIIPFLYSYSYRPRFIFDINDKNIKETMYLVAPLFLGLGITQINKVVDKSIASSITEGGISALSYASVINNAIQELIVTSAITILFAECARWVAEKRDDEIRKKVNSIFEIILVLLIPLSFAVYTNSDLIVRIIFARGVFDHNSILLTQECLRFYTIGLVFIALRDTLIKVFYAYKETKITTRVSIFSIILNIILNFILSSYIGLSGLALATSISIIINFLLLYYLLQKRMGDFGLLNIGKLAIKMIVFSVPMVILMNQVRSIIECNDILTLLISLLSGFSFICCLLGLTNDKVFNRILSSLSKKVLK